MILPSRIPLAVGGNRPEPPPLLAGTAGGRVSFPPAVPDVRLFSGRVLAGDFVVITGVGTGDGLRVAEGGVPEGPQKA
jgi:hypothetical protein